MKSAVLAPREVPPDLTEIKRALLTYDTVEIIDPSDRDLFPPSAMGAVLGNPFLPSPMAGDGAISRLGKVSTFGNEFDQLLDVLKPAIVQGSVSVKRTYAPVTFQAHPFSPIDLGGYPLHPGFLWQTFRSAIWNENFVAAALEHDPLIASLSRQDAELLGGGWAAGNADVNGSGFAPDYRGNLRHPENRALLSAIARARIGSTIKILGFASAKDLVPLGADPALKAIADAIIRSAASFADQASTEDPTWARRSAVLRVAHSEYIDNAVLSSIGVEDVLGLRSRAWGIQASARDSLLDSASMLARELPEGPEFEAQVRERIGQYRQSIEQVVSERGGLRFRVTCDLGIGGAGAIGSGLGELTQIPTAFTVPALLLAGCIFGLQQLKVYRPALDALKALEDDLKGDACYGIHSFYGP